jgi:hypothetical protein
MFSYSLQVTGDITVTDPNALHGTDGVTWSHGTGVWKYTVNDARNAPSNIAVCLEARSPRVWRGHPRCLQSDCFFLHALSASRRCSQAVWLIDEGHIIPASPSPAALMLSEGKLCGRVQAECASACPFASQFVRATADFAGSLRRWNDAFNVAYDRMTKIGAQWGPVTTTVVLPRAPPALITATSRRRNVAQDDEE